VSQPDSACEDPFIRFAFVQLAFDLIWCSVIGCQRAMDDQQKK